MKEFIDLQALSYETKKLIKKKVCDFFRGVDFLDNLPRLIYVARYKTANEDERFKYLQYIDFENTELLININTAEPVRYDYRKREVCNYIDFFFSINRARVHFPDLNTLHKKLKDVYSSPGSLQLFESRGLERIFVDCYEFEIDFQHRDYLSLIMGQEDEYFIDLQEFNQYKQEVVENYVVNGLIGALAGPIKSTRTRRI